VASVAIGVVELATCLRLELYIDAGDSTELIRNILVQAGFAVVEARRDITRRISQLACGLESQIVGELQICRQMEIAVAESREAGRLSRELDRAFSTGLGVARLARRAHGFYNSTSYASIAAKLLCGRVRRGLMVIGSGAMAKDFLCNANISKLTDDPLINFFIANRTTRRAQELVRDCGLGPIFVVLSTDEIAEFSKYVDAVFVASGGRLAFGGLGSEIVIADISFPPAVIRPIPPNVNLITVYSPIFDAEIAIGNVDMLSSVADVRGYIDEYLESV
jgi:glutamyl-tRNA reductase